VTGAEWETIFEELYLRVYAPLRNPRRPKPGRKEQ